MAISMTGSGFGRVQHTGFDVSVFIKGVNHRYLQMNIRLPEELMQQEFAIRKKVSGVVSRGRIDLSVTITFSDEDKEAFKINVEKIRRILEAGRSLAEKLGIEHGFTLERLLRYPDIIPASPLRSGETHKIADILMEAVSTALEQFMTSKKIEGSHLSEDIHARCVTMMDDLTKLKVYAKDQPILIKHSLEEKLRSLLENHKQVFDESRLEQEIVLLAARSDITEEIVRLGNHLEQIKKLIHEMGTVGKRCEFLIQEIHREISTIGAKSSDRRILDIIIAMKTNTERIREQIQNIE